MNASKNRILIGAMSWAVMWIAFNCLAQDVPSKWYLGLDTGLALQQDTTLENNDEAKLSFDPGFRLDVSGGMYLSRSWRAEVEVGFIYNSVSSIAGESTGSGNPDYFQVPIMANVLYTLPFHGPLSAYVGVGVGGVATMLWTDFLDSQEGSAFGYQAIVGVKYALNEDLDLGLSYKFLGTAEHDLGAASVEGTFSHAILAAVTFKF